MLSVLPNRPFYAPGDTIIAVITLILDKPAKARGIYARLECIEKSKVKVSKVIDQYDLDRAAELGVPYSGTIKWREEERLTVFFEEEKKISNEGDYSSGTFLAKFILPKNAPPTAKDYGQGGKTTEWRITAKLNIPLAPDENGTTEVIVKAR
jgi:hypothetical protein